MTLGTRGGNRDENIKAFTARWGGHLTTNPLLIARDRRRMSSQGPSYDDHTLNDVNINYNSHALTPMVRPMVEPVITPMVKPLVRKFGANTLEQRGHRGSRSLWANTPVASVDNVKVLGDVEIDLSDILIDFDRVGWEWDKKNNRLCAYLTKGEKTYKAKLPLRTLQRIFNRCVREEGGETNYFRERTLDGFFKKLGRGLKKAAKGVGRSLKRAVKAPVRFVKNPKRFIRKAGKSLKKVVKGVGKVALNVASSPIFAGAMTAIAAIPPLTAVGGAGLAAYAAANAIKPAFKAVEKGIDIADSIGKKKPGRAIKALTSGRSIKADKMTKNFRSGYRSLPGPAKRMMAAALKSTESRQLTKKERKNRKRRAAFRFMRKRNMIRRLR